MKEEHIVHVRAEKWALASVYFALLLDNLLLTAVVPILPHYIHHNHKEFLTNDTLKENDHLFEIGRGYYHPDMGDNSRLGLLLSLKAIVQLVANPLVALLCNRLSSGFTLPLIAGTVNIVGCSLLFAFGRTYEILAIARALQGLTSACFTIAGLGLVASIYRKDESGRSVALGRALGGGAVGVLLGYPIGGFLYQLSGKTVPFLLISTLSVILLFSFMFTLHFLSLDGPGMNHLEDGEGESTSVDEASIKEEYVGRRIKPLLGISVGAIFLSTSVMALLEPCLPLWLMETFKPQRWQLGAVFIPDSCGYLLTTHFLGGFSYRFGRWRVAILSMILIGVSCLIVPLAGSIIYLTLPHFGIGFGIGAVDASLVPLLATLADQNRDGTGSVSYGGTFALGQTAVSLAYCLGPLLGGFLVESIRFPTLMLIMGVLNLTYSPIILFLKPNSNQEVTEKTALSLFPKRTTGRYVRFQDEE